MSSNTAARDEHQTDTITASELDDVIMRLVADGLLEMGVCPEQGPCFWPTEKGREALDMRLV